MAASRRDINRDPCGRCIKSHFRCNVQFPFSNVLCEKCSKAGLESCPRRVPQPPTETTWHIVGADNYGAPQPTMTPAQTAPIKVNGPAGSLWDEQEMMTELMAYLDWLARNPPPNDQPTTDTTYTPDEAMNYYPVNYHDTNTYLGHAPMEGGSGTANTPEAEVGWQGVAPWPDSPADALDFNSSLTYGPYTYHGAFDDHELSDYQSS